MSATTVSRPETVHAQAAVDASLPDHKPYCDERVRVGAMAGHVCGVLATDTKNRRLTCCTPYVVLNAPPKRDRVKALKELGLPDPVVDKVAALARLAAGSPVRGQDVGWLLGYSHGEEVWVGIENPMIVIGPARSGKGVHIVIPAIIEAPGAVITTSTRADNMKATALCRGARGDVHVFNLDKVGGYPTTIRWSPLEGCLDTEFAMARAQTLVASSGIGQGGQNAEWATASAGIVQAMLQAAAYADLTIEDVYRWSRSKENAAEPRAILEQGRALGRLVDKWDEDLATIERSEPKIAESKWFGVSNAFAGMASFETRKLMSWKRSDPGLFDTRRFLESAGTVYMMSKGANAGGSTAGTVGTVYSMFLDHVTDMARVLSQSAAGDRMDPPLTMVLDELANIHPWPAVGRMMSAGSGEGIQIIAVFQSAAQIALSYGKEAYDVMWDNSLNVMLGGAKDRKFLDDISAMTGTTTRTETQKSYTSAALFQVNTSESVREVPGIKPDELRRLPFGCSLVLERSSNLILADMVPYWKGAHARCIKASKKWHKNNPGKVLISEVHTRSQHEGSRR